MAYADTVKIASVVALYFAVSITLVFANKILMPAGKESSTTTIDAPLFVTWFQCVLTATIIYILGLISHSAREDSWLKEFPRVSVNALVAVKVAPLSLMFLGMIAFNNLCLKYVSVPFYNVARSLTIVTNVIFSYLLLGDRTSFKVCLTLCVVIVGFYVGIEGELDFSLIGTLFGVASSCFVSLNAIYTKKTMPIVDGDKWKLSWYNNLNASIIFLPLIFIAGEHRTIIAHSDVLLTGYYWLMMLVAGFLGFAIGIVTVMQINVTSPLTHNISGTAKACVQTILAILLFHASWTYKGMTGIMLTIFGSLLYAVVKMRENENSGPVKSSQPSAANYQPVVQGELKSIDENFDDEDDRVEKGKITTQK